MARTGAGGRPDLQHRGDPGLRDAAPGRPLSVIEYGRLGTCDRVPVRQHRWPRSTQRHLGHSADLDRPARPGREPADLFPDLGDRRGGPVRLLQPPRLPHRPRHARAPRRQYAGRKPGDQRIPDQAGDVRHRRVPRRAIGMALCPSRPFRQPRAVRRQHGHRISDDGDGRRRRQHLGRRGWCCDRHTPEEFRAGLPAADREGCFRPARDRGVLGAVHSVPATRPAGHRPVPFRVST